MTCSDMIGEVLRSLPVGLLENDCIFLLFFSSSYFSLIRVDDGSDPFPVVVITGY